MNGRFRWVWILAWVWASMAGAQSGRPGMGSIPYSSGVTFRVWAPYATSVSVRGDFNAWGETAMVSEGNGNWSVDVNGATVGQHYKYFLNGNTYKRDPRSRQVTSSSGNSVIYDPNAYDWGGVPTPQPGRNDVVYYQMHVGTFEGGNVPRTFDQAIARLDHVKNLGISAIKLMPVNEFPAGLSWGYNPTDLFAIENEYGGPDALKRFMKACHERGIAVAMDVVHNHYGPTDLDLWQFDGWSQNNLGGIYFYNDDRAHTPWGSTRPDFGRSEVYSFIRDQIMMWVEEYRIGAFRWDSVYNIINTDVGYNEQGNHLLRDINWELSQTYPQVIRGSEDNAFDYNMNFENQWDVAYRWDLHSQVTTASDADRNMWAVKSLLDGWAGHQRVVFSEAHDYIAKNHDRSRIPSEIDPGNPGSIWARKRALLAAGIVMTTPGIPMIFQGQEMHETQAFHDDTPLRWNLTNTYAGIVQAYSDLIHSRRNLYGGMQGLKGSGVNVHHVDDNNKVVAFIRWDAGGQTDDVLVVANFASKTWTNQNYEIVFPSEGTWYSHFNSDSQTYQGDFGGIGSVVLTASGSPAKATVDMGMYSLQIFSKTAPEGLHIPSSVTFDPAVPSACDPVTITYDAGTDVLENEAQVYIFIGRNDWQDVIDPNPAMTSLGSNRWQYTYATPPDTYQIDLVFHNGSGVWDNHNGQDWHLTFTNCGTPPPVPSVEFDPSDPSGCVSVAIRFDPTNGVLQGAAQVYARIGRNGWQTVEDPDPSMSSLGDGRWEIDYAIPPYTEELNLVFTDGAGTWEDNGGAGWHVAVANCHAGPATQLGFATPERSTLAGVTSEVITVELRDADGHAAVRDAPTTVALSSSHTGYFLHASDGSVISQLVLAAGGTSADFRYISSSLGTHVLSVSSDGLTGASQSLTVTSQDTVTLDASGSFTVPAGVTNLYIQAWGGGGGPRNDGTTRRGGGGGGAYAQANVPVVPGSNYAVVVGAGGTIYHEGTTGNSGGDSYFAAGAHLLARGGQGGDDSGGAGGSASASVGQVKYSGGAGGNRGQFTGGAGGGSAFTNANGEAGQDGPGSRTQSALGGTGTGDGGTGGANVHGGSPGHVPGGGGGGRGSNGGNGGGGAHGRVVITYQVEVAPEAPPVIFTHPASQTVSVGSSVSLSVEATGTAPLFTVWFKNDEFHASGSASLSFASVEPADAGAYHAVVSNAYGSATSTVAVLTVDAGPFHLMITNPSTRTTYVANAVSSHTVQGRVGTSVVGQVSWTNALTGGSGSSALSGTNFSLASIPLEVGTNVIVVSGTNAPAPGGIVAEDHAGNSAYTDGWQSGDNGGAGFAAWTLGVSGNAGHWQATQANNPNLAVAATAWGMWANGGGVATAVRPFNSVLQPGQTFRLKFENGWIETGQSVGFALQNAAGEYLLEFLFIGGATHYQINDHIDARSSGIGWTDAGLDLAIELESGSAYALRTGAATFTGSLKTRGDMQIARLQAWNNSAGTGDNYNFYLANLAVTNPPGASSTAADEVSIVREPMAEPESHTLTVQSAHGSPSPAVGSHIFTAETVVANAVAEPAAAHGTQWLCIGWELTGHDPAAGTSNQFAMTLTNDAALRWLWTTNHWLETSSDGHGTVEPASSWQPAGSLIPVLATPDIYYDFSHWSGDASGTAASTDVAMGGARTVQGNFAERLAAHDTPEWWLAHHGWTSDFNEAAMLDPDEDGFLNWQEYVADTDPTNSVSALRLSGAYVRSGGDLETGEIRFSFPASTGRYYQLFFRTNILSPTQTNNLGWGVADMVVTNNTHGAWYGGILVRLGPPEEN
jgi:1,4-alpha-glucan branching enzyme